MAVYVDGRGGRGGRGGCGGCGGRGGDVINAGIAVGRGTNIKIAAIIRPL